MPADTDKPNPIEYIIATQTAWFEMMVLKCVVSDREFRGRCLKVLCLDPINGKPVKDFSLDVDNAIYQAVATYCGITGGQTEATPPFIEALLTGMSRNNSWIGPSEIGEAMSRFQQIQALDLQPCLKMVSEGFRVWLGKRRAERVIRAHTALTTWNNDNMLREVRVNTAAIEMAEREDTFYEFGHGVDNEVLDVARSPLTDFDPLNEALGGGFANKESTLFVAPEGSGKTVLACKISSSLSAFQGKTGILITTEQNHEELEPRIISAHCNVPYSMIKDKFDKKLLNPMQADRYNRLRETIKGKLFIEDWGDADHGLSIEHDLLELLDKRQNQIGRKIDFVVLDWIGGALGKLTGQDGDKLTFIMRLAGNTVCQIAKDMDITTIAFAQANMATAVNKVRVDASHISNCKSLGQKFTNVIGLTHLYDLTQSVGEGDTPIYSNRQGFYVSKSRKGKTGFIPFLRRFEYQDMVPISWRAENFR